MIIHIFRYFSQKLRLEGSGGVHTNPLIGEPHTNPITHLIRFDTKKFCTRAKIRDDSWITNDLTWNRLVSFSKAHGHITSYLAIISLQWKNTHLPLRFNSFFTLGLHINKIKEFQFPINGNI